MELRDLDAIVVHGIYPDSMGVDYVYDLVGGLLQVTDPSGVYGFSYDGMGRQTGTTTQYSFLPGRTFTNMYTYNAASQRTSFTAPDGSTNSYQYDTGGRLSDLTNSWAGHSGFGYDELNRRTSLTRPNSVNTMYQYDATSHLLAVLHQSGGNTIDGAAYGYDDTGTRISKQNLLNGTNETYGYDDTYQLTQVQRNGAASEGYSYDSVGNRLSSIGQSGLQYDSANQLIYSSTTTYNYDSNGNISGKADASGTTQYAWDYENRLISAAVQAAGVTTYRYDPAGRRTQKSGPNGTTNYLYDGVNIVAEVNSVGVAIASYAHAQGIDEPLALARGATLAYYNADGLGSITSIHDGIGSLVNSYAYDSFGRRAGSTGMLGNPFQYTGRENDPETGLYYYRARYYDPSVGRFISEDPLRMAGGNNMFQYASNAPTLMSDPLGLLVEILCERVQQKHIGVITGAVHCRLHNQTEEFDESFEWLGGNGPTSLKHERFDPSRPGYPVSVTRPKNDKCQEFEKCIHRTISGYMAHPANLPDYDYWHANSNSLSLQIVRGCGGDADYSILQFIGLLDWFHIYGVMPEK